MANRNDALDIKYINTVNEKLVQGNNLLLSNNRVAVMKRLAEIGIDLYGWYRDDISNVYSAFNNGTNNQKERIRFFDITRWVTDPDEDNISKLSNVYQSLAGEKCNIALIISSRNNKNSIKLAISNTSDIADPNKVDRFIERLKGSLDGNFPGAEIKIPDEDEQLELNISREEVACISAFSNIPSEKSERFISQGIERIFDSYDNEEYDIVLIAQTTHKNGICGSVINTLYQYYNDLSPYAEVQQSSQLSDTVTATSSYTKSISLSTGLNVGGAAGPVSIGGNIGLGLSWSRTSAFTRTGGVTSGETTTYTDYTIKNTLKHIEAQIQRMEQSSALGLWKFAGYVLAKKASVALNVANSYNALMQGDNSYLESSPINGWTTYANNSDIHNIYDAISMLTHPLFYIKPEYENVEPYCYYPNSIDLGVFLTGKELAYAMSFPKKSVRDLPVIETVSFGREPHMLQGGSLDIDLGNAYHMRKKIDTRRIAISKEELTKHTFITGATGSGKSNTIYKLIECLGNERVPFLVIEPAKGEYKEIFGKMKGVSTFTTNPNIAEYQMLRLNPFSFPRSTHVLEHMDRLVEIFNVCWPMYAAMPAILKDAIERSYVATGWDIIKSENRYDNLLFPTFSDVVKQIKIVLDESDYSADNKGDYTGSLVTRLKSLTNGINGLIFSSNSISDNQLFDQNTIVDLSRVGSTETKSLIMGILVLKLQEYRMDQRACGSNLNDSLKHVTVLEEAHNLLKRTSTDQSSEGANLLGKSVEMLANSIAEMRTYGEGFVIADQSPGLLDMSVIRNTNTKIILRLPDFSDRDLVGRASGLNENQIIELSRLEKGVAAISQSNWLEPVLCKVDKYSGENGNYDFAIKHKETLINNAKVEKALLDCIIKKEIYRKGDRIDIHKLREEVIKSDLSTEVKCSYLEYIYSEEKNAMEKLGTLAYHFFNAEKAMAKAIYHYDIKEWSNIVLSELTPSVSHCSKEQKHILLSLLITERALRDKEYHDLLSRFTEIHIAEKGAF